MAKIDEDRLTQIMVYCQKGYSIDDILKSDAWRLMKPDFKYENLLMGKFSRVFDLFPGNAKDCMISLFRNFTLEPGDIPSKAGVAWLAEYGFAVQIHGPDGYRWALTPMGANFWRNHPDHLEQVQQRTVLQDPLSAKTS